MKKNIIITIVILFLAGLVWWSMGGNNKKEEIKTLQQMTSREVALRMTTDMATEFHIHPELKIFINGDEVLVPHNLGVTKDGMTAIHTHEDYPKLHVEAPIQKDFTLGDFFAVWNQNFSKTQLLTKTVDEKSEIAMTINGLHVDTYENTILKDKDQIVISYQAKKK